MAILFIIHSLQLMKTAIIQDNQVARGLSYHVC